MKCEHCNNDMIWQGSLQGGRMNCPHCTVITYPLSPSEATNWGVCSAEANANGYGIGIANPVPDPIDLDVWDYDL